MGRHCASEWDIVSKGPSEWLNRSHMRYGVAFFKSVFTVTSKLIRIN